MEPLYGPSTIAAGAPTSTSAPNAGSRRYPYKVFLSFRGEDTGNNFVSHLRKELTQKGIHPFKDYHDLKRGDSLTPSLLEAISGSRVAVVVLSEHYASSTWCLKELVEIMECRERNGQMVVPIFYKVDPSDVKNQRGSFGDDLKKHEKKRKRENDYEAEMKKWRNTLSQVATIAGWDSRNRVCMHQLLQEMGCEIVRRESKKLGERSRLWDFKDIRYVLTKKKGTEMIKGISLNLSEIQSKMILEEDAFVGMDRLRFLKVYASGTWDPRKLHIPNKLQLPRCGFQFYSDELAYFYWHGWPQKSSPFQFCAQNLIELDMSYSKVETLWEGPQEFVNLKILNLEGSDCLVRIPDLSKAPNIVRINLTECENLVEVHSSIQYLDKLENLELENCTNLEILPSRLDSNVLNYICFRRCCKVKKCPEFPPCSSLYIGNMRSRYDPFSENLELAKCLDLSETCITELPWSIEFANTMKTLDVTGCKSLSQLPNWLSNFKSLKNICLKHTSVTELPQLIENLTLLEKLDLFRCEKLESLPTNLHRLSSLRMIDIRYCKRLHSIPKLPLFLSSLRASHCELLENFSDNSKDDIGETKYVCCFEFKECFKLSEKARNNILSFALSTFQKCKPPQGVAFLLTGSEMPPWIREQAVGSSINVQTPFNFAEVICCLVFNGEGLSLPPHPSLMYKCQFKGDNRNQDHIEDIWGRPFYFERYNSSSNDMVLFKLERPEALDCVVVNELSFELLFRSTNARYSGRLFEMKVKKCGICFLN